MSEKEVAFHDRGLVTHKSLTLFPIANFTGLFLHSGNICCVPIMCKALCLVLGLQRVDTCSELRFMCRG